MPSEPKPKRFVANAGFLYAHRAYTKGEEVTDRRVIDALVRYGDRFIVAKRAKPTTPDQEEASN